MGRVGGRESIQLLKEHISKLQVQDSWLDEFLGAWGKSGWLKSNLKSTLIAVRIFLCIIICIPRILQCVQCLIDRAIWTVLLVEKKRGDMGLNNAGSISGLSLEHNSTSDLVELAGGKPWEQ